MTLANGILYERIGPCTNQAGLPGTAIGDTHTDISCASISAVVHRLRRETRRHGQRADAGVQTIRQGDRTPVTRANEEFACDVRDALGDVSCIDHGAGLGWKRTSAHARTVRGRRPPIGRGRCSGATSCRAESLIPKGVHVCFSYMDERSVHSITANVRTPMPFVLLFRKATGKLACRGDMSLQRVVHKARIYSPPAANCYIDMYGSRGRVSTP